MKLGKQILKRIEKEKRQERRDIGRDEKLAQKIRKIEEEIDRKYSELLGGVNEKIRKHSG